MKTHIEFFPAERPLRSLPEYTTSRSSPIELLYGRTYNLRILNRFFHVNDLLLALPL